MSSVGQASGHQVQVSALIQATSDFGNNYGVALSQEIENNSLLLLAWIEYLHKFHITGTANELLSAIHSSIMETASCISLGLVRPALFSMRSQIDLALFWLYFKDHSVEWDHVNKTGDGFKLKKEILEYLRTHDKGFDNRYGILKLISTRHEVDTYRLLSAHIHGQSKPVLPATTQLQDVVRDITICNECAVVAKETAEYINDIMISVYANKWQSLPELITTSTEQRFLSQAQKKQFFEGI